MANIFDSVSTPTKEIFNNIYTPVENRTEDIFEHTYTPLVNRMADFINNISEHTSATKVTFILGLENFSVEKREICPFRF